MTTGDHRCRTRRRLEAPKIGPLVSDDRGDVMVWVVVATPFLLTGLMALVSAGQWWEANREAHAVAAAAARAAAQPDPTMFRATAGSTVAGDVGASGSRAAEVVGREEATASASVTVDATSVQVIVDLPVDYTFGSFGLPVTVRGSGSAARLSGIGGSGVLTP